MVNSMVKPEEREEEKENSPWPEPGPPPSCLHTHGSRAWVHKGRERLRDLRDKILTLASFLAISTQNDSSIGNDRSRANITALKPWCPTINQKSLIWSEMGTNHKELKAEGLKVSSTQGHKTSQPQVTAKKQFNPFFLSEKFLTCNLPKSVN